MEEKKFPWLLRLLSTNSSCVHMLETYAIHKEKIISNFINDSNYSLTQKTSKSLPFSSLSPLIDYLNTQSTGASTSCIKHVFFIYKSKRTEIPHSLLRSYSIKKKSVPQISYIQLTRSPLKSLIKWEVEYTRTGYKSSIFPESSSQTFLEQAKEISKEIISLVELHETKKIQKLCLEFFVDSCLKLVLSYMPLCVLSTKEYLHKSSSNLNPNLYIKTNELNDIVNELSSPSRVLKRQPSIIRIVDRKNSFFEKVEIDSPVIKNQPNSSESQSSLDNEPETASKDQSPEQKTKYDKNFLEILCKMRIIHKSGSKKHFFTDKEIQEERDTIADLLQMANRKEAEKMKHKKSIEFRKFDSGKFQKAKVSALNLISGKFINKRSGSLEELALPVLSSRSIKNKSILSKGWN